MTLDDIRFIFNRALKASFSYRKLLLVFTVLVMCGLLVVFFRSLAINAGEWIQLSLTFLPIFLCAGVLFSTGIILVRIYHDEIKQREVVYRDILAKSWEIVIGASYFCIPIILCYLLLWMLMGVFFLFREIPVVGEAFSVILSFAPFLINFGSIVLCVLALGILFFATPAIALRGLNGMQVSQDLVQRLNADIFSNLLLAFISLIPLAVVIGILSLSATMTGSICYTCDNPIFITLRWFFIMVPFVALLAPAVTFFFNFSAESHVLMRKLLKRKS
ncbi:MAG: hypothetical protein H7A37_07565 [Chlamydiales bacterium]|nr:hypothetical protein [Chlamydiia bacterium]MCP5508142.1 hypothetical protein [Chlamydiales bacterium]